MAYKPKEGNVTATFGPYFYKTNNPSADDKRSFPWSEDFGLIANGDISDKGSLEIAMFHMNKVFFREQGPSMIAEKTQLMHITMGYRRWLTDYVSTSLALYSTYTMDSVEILYNDFPVGTPPVDTSARDNTEYGLDMSLMGELWSHDRWALALDARYSLQLTSKPNERADHYAAFLGVRYFIQEKQIVYGPKPK